MEKKKRLEYSVKMLMSHFMEIGGGLINTCLLLMFGNKLASILIYKDLPLSLWTPKNNQSLKKKKKRRRKEEECVYVCV